MREPPPDKGKAPGLRHPPEAPDATEIRSATTLTDQDNPNLHLQYGDGRPSVPQSDDLLGVPHCASCRLPGLSELVRRGVIPTDCELRQEVHRLVDGVCRMHGHIPSVRDPEWWTAPTSARLASLLVVAEAALLTRELDADRLKQASLAICSGLDWSAEADQPSHAELIRRRTASPVAHPRRRRMRHRREQVTT